MTRCRKAPRQRQLLLLWLLAIATACLFAPTSHAFTLDGAAAPLAGTRQLQATTPAAANHAEAVGQASTGSTAEAPSAGHIVYNCTVTVRGFGNSSSTSDSPAQYGVQYASLNCSSTPAAAAPLQVGYNSSIMGDFVTAFKGVKPHANTSCQVKPYENETALFYFCCPQHVVLHLWKPRGEGVWLAKPGDGKDFSMFAFAGNGSAFVSDGELLHNHAGTAFTVADSAALTVSGTRVFGNVAKGGGALRLSDTSKAIITDQSVFRNNSADYGGAAYVFGNASLNVTGSSVLANNTASIKSDSTKGNGGAVYAKDDAAILIGDRSKLISNTAANGGAVSLEGHTECTVTSGAVIAHNSATDKTGGGFFLKEDARCMLSSVTLVGNHAKKQGGGVGLEDRSRTVCTITDGSRVYQNAADVQGGAVYVGSGSTAVISGAAQLYDNSAINGGAVLLTADDSKGTTYLNISGPGTALVANKATAGGAINVYANNKDDKQCHISVVDSVRITDHALESGGGGGGYVSSGACNATFVDVVFDNNTDSKTAGAFAVYQSANVTFVNCTLSRSTAKDAGAASIGENATATFIDSIIESHAAIHSGGAFRVVENSALTLINTIIQNCSALTGGAVDIEDNGAVRLYNSSLKGNNATTNGGAVFMLGPGTPRFELHNNSSCIANKANVSGGCAYLLTAGQLDADATSFVKQNTARFGGGIALAALENTPDLSKLRKASRNNTARMFGPDLYVDYTDVSLSLTHIAVNGEPLSVEELAKSGNVILYVSRSSGPGLNISVTATSKQEGHSSFGASKLLPTAANIKVEAQLLDDKGAAAADSNSSSSAAAGSHYDFLGSATTDDNGTALFPDLQPHRPPGNYTLVLQYTRLDGVPFKQQYTLWVRRCVLGEVSQDSETCDVCPAGQYCLSPAPWNRNCEQCNTKTANCSAGGAVVVPLPGCWQRSPDSALMFRCLKQAACSNDYNKLWQLHPYRNLTDPTLGCASATPALLVDSSAASRSPNSFVVLYNNSNSSATEQQVSAYLAAQCAVGYTGTLCATCQPGYGMTKQYTCSQCMPAQAVAVLYAFGAIALMILIRIMMHLSTHSDNVGMKRWTAAALATGRRQPTAAAAAAEEGRSTRCRKAADEPAAAAAVPAADVAARPAAGDSSSLPVVKLVGARLEVAPHTSVAERQRSVPALPSSVLKVLVLYMQYMLIISGMQVEWPNTLAGPFTALAGLWGGTSSEALSLECLMPGRQAAMLAAAAAGYSAAPLGVLRVLLFVVAPIVMYIILVACECLWNVSKPWIQPAFHRCMSQHVAPRVGGFIPGLAQWQQARSEGQGVAAPEPAGAEVDSEEESYRNLEQLTGSNLEGTTAIEPLSGTNSASAQPGGDAAATSSSDRRLRCWYFPSPAWCGVLAMVTVFFFLTSLARAALGLFMCYSLDADPHAIQERKPYLGQESLWMLNFSELCMGSEHKKWALGLGIPLVVLLYVCLPISVGVLLFMFRYRLTDSWVQRHFGFLYVHYRPEHYLWEVMTIMQTLFVVVSSVTANYIGVYNQGLLLNAMLAIIFTMLVLFKPNASRQVQLLNYASVGVQLFTTYAALSFVSASDSAVAMAAARGDDQPVRGFEHYKTTMGVVVLLANLAFIIGLILVLLSTLPSAFWQAWKHGLLRQWRALQIRCRAACGRRRAPVASMPSMLAARTASGHPVLVRLDAHKQLQMTTARNVVDTSRRDQS